jgi:hypothetical protein
MAGYRAKFTLTFNFYFNVEGPDISVRESSCLFQWLLKIIPRQSGKTKSMWCVLFLEVQPDVCLNFATDEVFKSLPISYKHTLMQLPLCFLLTDFAEILYQQQ